MQFQIKGRIAKVALRTSLFYAVVGGAWILFSGRILVAFISDPDALIRLDIYKDWAFVGVSAVFLYAILRTQLQRLEQEAGERQRAETALRNSDEQHRAVLEHQMEMISRFKADHTYTFVNDVFCQFYGKTREELLGSKWHPEVLPEDLPLVEEKIKSLSPANPIVLIENRVRSGSGEARWMQFSHRALFDGQNRLVEIQSVGRDVTDRKQAEAALRNSEHLLRLVMDLVPHFIFVKDKNSRHLLVNRACAGATTLTPEQMVGLSDMDLSPDSAQAKAFMKDDQEVISSGKPKFSEEKLTDAHGHTRILQTTKIPFPASAISSPVAGNGKPAILGVSVDVTARRLAEDVLQQKQDQLVEALRIARLAYWEYDVLEDKFTFNDQFYSILHTTAKREGGYIMCAAEYSRRFIHPDDAAIIGIEIQKAIAATDPNYSQELDHRIIYADGNVGYFNVHIRIQKDAQGRTIKTHGAVMDITDRKRAELQVVESRNYLGKIIDSITDPIFVKDRQHRWVLLNDAFCGLMGHTREELLGKSDCDFFPKAEADVFWLKDEVVFTTGKENINEEEFTDGKGETHTIMTKKALYTDEQGETLIVGIIRDITKHKRAEQNLEMYVFSIDQASDAIFWMTHDGGLTYVNEQACRSLGYTREELMRLHLWDFDPTYPKELWDADWKKFREDKGGAQQIDTLHHRKDGSVFPVSISTKHLWFGHSELHVAVARDVTERKKSEETIVHERQLLRTLIDMLPETFYIKDLESRFLVANESLAKRFGKKTPAQVLGLSDMDLFPAELAAGFRAGELKVFGGEPLIDHEDSIAFPDGRNYTLLTTKVPFRDSQGKIQGLVGIGRDITERKRTEEENARLATAVRQAAESIIITNTKGTILYVNPAFEKITGYQSSEVVGQNPRFLKSGKHDAAFYHHMWDILSQGKVWNGRIINKKKNGVLYEEETSISPVVDSTGKIVNYVAVKHDVTQEVAMESQLRQAQKMEIIGQLAGGVAHDFNNILTVIQGNAALSLNGEMKQAEKEECTQQIIHAAERAATLTRQLLMFSRKQVMQPVNLNLNETVAQMTKMLRRVLGENIALQSNYAANLPIIYGDIGMIEQILMNLVVNARDAMPDGGSLTIATGMTMFDQRQAEQNPGASPGPHVWLAVSDTGSGIAPEHLPRIFEPFFTTKEVGKGTGLGLATVYGIVQQHHGWINVNSDVNRGATFQIYFPVSTYPGPETNSPPVS